MRLENNKILITTVSSIIGLGLIIFLLIISHFINNFEWKSNGFCINPSTFYGFFDRFPKGILNY